MGGAGNRIAAAGPRLRNAGTELAAGRSVMFAIEHVLPFSVGVDCVSFSKVPAVASSHAAALEKGVDVVNEVFVKETGPTGF